MKKLLILAAVLAASSSVYAGSVDSNDNRAPQLGDVCVMGNVTGHIVEFLGFLVCVGPPDTTDNSGG